MKRAIKKTEAHGAEATSMSAVAETHEPIRAPARKRAAPKLKAPEPSIVEAKPPEGKPVAKTASAKGSSASKASAGAKTPALPKVAAPSKTSDLSKTSAGSRMPAGSKTAAGAKKRPAPPAKPAAKIETPKTVAKPAAVKATARKAATKKTPVKKVAVHKASGGQVIEPLEAGAEIKLGFLAGFVGFHLRLAQDASYRTFSRHRDKDLMKPGRLPALAIIHLNPGISQSALGRAIARDKSTVSPLIKDLQKNGFISRKASTADRRSVTLALTKKGEKTLERLQARAQEHENEIDKIVGASKARLLSMLDKITTGMAA